MQKYTICSLLLLLGLASAATFGTDIQAQISSPVCGAYQWLTPSGCWTSCSDPRFRSCGDVFPALYNPSFCAYTRDGQYSSYTYDCQACQKYQCCCCQKWSLFMRLPQVRFEPSLSRWSMRC